MYLPSEGYHKQIWLYKPPHISHSIILLWVVWSHVKGNASCFICETFAASADNLLDTWIPINLFKCLRAIIPTPRTWEAKRRGSARRSLMVVSRLLGLAQTWSWDLDEPVAMTAGTLLLSCLFPPLGSGIIQQPTCEYKVTVSSISSTWQLHSPVRWVIHLQWRTAVWRPFILSTGAPARLQYWRPNLKLRCAGHTEGLWSLGEGVFCAFYREWNLIPPKVNGKKTLSFESSWSGKTILAIILCYKKSKKVKYGLWCLSL